MLKALKIHMRLYWKCWIHMLKARMANRYDFLIYIFCDLIIQVLGVVFFWSVFSHIPDLKGWSYEQVLLIFGISQLSFGLFGLLFNGMHDFGNILYSGRFDSILVRPFHPLFQMLVGGFGDLGGLVTGVGIIAFVVSKGVIVFNFVNIILLIFFICNAAVLYLFMYAMIAGTSFFIPNSSSIFMSLLGSLIPFGRYPINIYPPLLKVVLTFLIPMGYVGFYPAAFFMDSTYNSYVFLQPLLVVIFGSLTIGMWKAGVSRYKSTGN